MKPAAPQPDWHRERASYVKTCGLALSTAVASVALLYVARLLLRTPWVYLLGAIGMGLLAASVLVLGGGIVILRRQIREAQNRPDPFFMAFSRRPVVRQGWRKWIRPLFGSTPRVGDLVVVRDSDEIAATLDGQGRLDGLPFMPEMLPFCGKAFVVDRRIDKINDWLGGSVIRQMKDVVTLIDVRCTGADHGGCQARCHILWKTHWLRRVSRARASKSPSSASLRPRDTESIQGLLAASSRLQSNVEEGSAVKYVCQITELLPASVPMHKWDLRQDLRPLLYGNIGLTGYLVAQLTWVFDKVQLSRGGVGYPVLGAQLESGPTPVAQLNLAPGELVRVRSKHEIGSTLFKNHNRGMWFGKETLRHCGQQYRVLDRVTRIIDERSGEMKEMKTAAIILEGVTGTGEFLRFCPQNDYVFWREIWLERVASRSAAPSLYAGQNPVAPSENIS